ncbi:MAG: type II toxin-antitoxin system prevent-host-death family antitoxin [Caldilinea sp. CFX5]|nr:type II toxin-antitoxin system prevent-host-death family antitoxin [Caldilinea sp. CFX5]
MKTPQIVPVSDLRMKHLQVFNLMNNGPVFLAQRSKPAGVLVSVEQWDRLMERLDEQNDLIDALKMELAIARGEETVETISEAEIEAWLSVDEKVPA